MKANKKILNSESFQVETTKSSEVEVLLRRVARLKEEVDGGISKVVINNEIRLIKDQIKKLEKIL